LIGGLCQYERPRAEREDDQQDAANRHKRCRINSPN
jgi:hypothetical protein